MYSSFSTLKEVPLINLSNIKNYWKKILKNAKNPTRGSWVRSAMLKRQGIEQPTASGQVQIPMKAKIKGKFYNFYELLFVGKLVLRLAQEVRQWMKFLRTRVKAHE